MKKVYFLPNLITTGSLFCALLAIMHIIRGQVEMDTGVARAHFQHACWLILVSAILDGLDGTVARLTKTASSFGLNYDSLSDLVAFGVAPAFLMFAKLNRFDDSIEFSRLTPRVADAVVALYAICGALRLARFNVQVAHEEKHSFTGLPIPAAAGTVVSTYLVLDQLADSRMLFRGILVIMALLSYLMISTIPFPSPKAINLRGRRPFDLLVTTIITACIVVALRRTLEVVVLAGFMVYITVAVTRHFFFRTAERSLAPASGPSEGAAGELPSAPATPDPGESPDRENLD